jgi:hypothetical protein
MLLPNGDNGGAVGSVYVMDSTFTNTDVGLQITVPRVVRDKALLW